MDSLVISALQHSWLQIKLDTNFVSVL